MSKTKTVGLSLAIFPTLGEIGSVRIRNKTVIAFGPLRLSIHRVVGKLKDYTR